ncbi:MAG: HD domain-containing protein [Anaerolineae bacterium]
MEREKGYSEQYEEALRVATVAHRRQVRKGSGLPYIIHPVHVSVILLRHGFSMGCAIAGLLHDVVEDQGYDLTEIEARFGARVAETVGALSERKSDADGVKRPWDVRKREALQEMRGASRQTVAVKCADTLHNAHSFVHDLRREGAEVWQHFNRGPQSQLSYYRQILEIAEERLSAHPLVAELAHAVAELARAIKETGTE